MPSLAKEEIKDLVFDEVEKYVGMTQTEREEAFKLYKRYKGKLDVDKSYPWSSKKFIGETKNGVDLLSAFLAGGQVAYEVIPEYGIYNEVSVEQEEMKNQESKAELHQNLLNFTAHRVLELWRYKKTLIKQGVWAGTSPALLVWDFKEKKVEKKTKGKSTVIEVASEIVRNKPVLYPINFFDYYTDPTAIDEQVADSVVIGTDIPIHLLEEDETYDQKAVKRLKESLKKRNPFQILGIQSNYASSRCLNNLDYGSGLALVKSVPSNYVRVYHRFGRHEYIEDGKKKEGECVITVAGESKSDGEFLRITPNNLGLRPLAVFKLQDPAVPGRTYGESPFKQAMPLQDLENALVNMIVDNGMTVWQQGWKLKTGANIDENELFAFPNYVVHCENMEDVEPMPAVDIRQGAFKLLDFIDRKFQKFTGVSDALSGMVTAHTTATQSELAQSNSNIKIEDARQNVETFFSKMGEILYEMILANSDEGKVFNIYNPATRKIEKISVADMKKLKGRFLVRVRTDSTLMMPRSVELKMLMNAIEKFQNIEGFNAANAAKRWFRKSGDPNTEFYFPQQPPEEEMPKEEFGGLPLTAAGEGGLPQGAPPEAMMAAGMKPMRGGTNMPPSEQNTEANMIKSINQ